jgi:thioredoxin reductase
MKLQADVAIVSGGPTGLTVAIKLAIAGVPATVLERRTERGSSFRCNPTVASVIASATTPEQVRQNASAFGIRLSEADLAELDRCIA